VIDVVHWSTNLQTYRKNHEAKILKGGPRPVQVMNPMSGQAMDVLENEASEEKPPFIGENLELD